MCSSATIPTLHHFWCLVFGVWLFIYTIQNGEFKVIMKFRRTEDNFYKFRIDPGEFLTEGQRVSHNHRYFIVSGIVYTGRRGTSGFCVLEPM